MITAIVAGKTYRPKKKDHGPCKVVSVKNDKIEYIRLQGGMTFKMSPKEFEKLYDV